MSQDVISQAHDDQRAQNIACIRQYVDARTPEQRGRRWELYVDDCTSGAVAGVPLKGKEIARKCTEWNLVYFPNYVFNDNIIFQSTDPDYYCVMSKGTGGINFPAYGGERQYDNVYFHLIRMQGGRMKEYFEYSNLLGMYVALGLEIPHLDGPPGWPEHTPEEVAYDPYPKPQYSDPAHPDVIPAGDEALRAKNIACIRQYVDARTYDERNRRWDLYVDGGECTSGAAGLPVCMGKDKARQCTEWNMVYFPDYVFNNNVIFQTQDPNLFMVMSDGTGGIYYPAYGERKTYENRYFHTFRMRDGKIVHYYEYSNAKLLFDVLGVKMNAIQVPAGWPGEV
ncbi:MAG: PhzA/PhzB family protein [Ottowia sp.]|uniref:PhzA/PhzB family protein n=1 Tax=Ottowia sp. TaxID=1898956 RepID=UPI0039E53018